MLMFSNLSSKKIDDNFFIIGTKSPTMQEIGTNLTSFLLLRQKRQIHSFIELLSCIFSRIGLVTLTNNFSLIIVFHWRIKSLKLGIKMERKKRWGNYWNKINLIATNFCSHWFFKESQIFLMEQTWIEITFFCFVLCSSVILHTIKNIVLLHVYYNNLFIIVAGLYER